MVKNRIFWRHLRQGGFGHIVLVLVLAVVIVAGLAGWRVYQTQKPKDEQNTTRQEPQTSNEVKITWSQTEDGWKASGTPPACPEPLLQLPIDISKATSILYPGQLRGGDYKPHGGFRFDNQKDNNITVTAPLDSELTSASRYIEMGEVQYFFVFVAPCGFTYRFDHLLVVDPKFQSVIDKLPPAKENDSRTTTVSPSVAVKAGDVIATQIGLNKERLNVFVDFGLYDMRSKNEISKDAAWAAAHPSANEQYGVCWFDYLSTEDEAKVRALTAGDGQSGKTSDYCE